ncbi:chitinase, partial [Martensiomyces pterosporus]
MRFATLLALGASLISHVVESKTVVGYLPSWKHQYTKDVNYSKYTHINVAFGIPSEDGSFSFEGDWFLPEVVSDIHSKGPKVLMSVGGWSGSNYLSNILKNSSTRDKFLNSITDYVRQYHLDGIDIDWEYPGREGNAGNAIDPQNDTPNFLKFLQDLRTKFDSSFGGEHKLITLAVRVQPFDGPSGPVADVSEFAKVVDFANLMQYDISGAWLKNTGPNAPFNYDKAKGEPFSFVSAINAWTSAGWPASQLNAGLAFYGRATTALVDMTQDPNNQYQPQSQTLPQGDKEDAPWGGSYSGVWQYKNLRAQSVLGSPESAAKPWVRQWDDITMTPWLFNPSDKMFISYDDTRSIGVKAKYAEERGLGGLMVWTINMD